MSLKKQSGFTLVELLVTIAVIAILAVVAIPSFESYVEKNRLRNAGEEVYGLLAEARSAAVLRSLDTKVNINAAQWCIGFSMDNAAGTASNCDCTKPAGDTAACEIPVATDSVFTTVTGANFSGVTMSTTSGNTSFSSIRGTAGSKTVTLDSGDWQVDIVISPLGRVKLCTPSGKPPMGYETC